MKHIRRDYSIHFDYFWLDDAKTKTLITYPMDSHGISRVKNQWFSRVNISQTPSIQPPAPNRSVSWAGSRYVVMDWECQSSLLDTVGEYCWMLLDSSLLVYVAIAATIRHVLPIGFMWNPGLTYDPSSERNTQKAVDFSIVFLWFPKPDLLGCS